MRRFALGIALAALAAACEQVDGGSAPSALSVSPSKATNAERAVESTPRAQSRASDAGASIPSANELGSGAVDPSGIGGNGAGTDELARARARVRELEAEVAHLREERIAREREWLEYTQSIARLHTIAELSTARFQPAPDVVGAERAPATGEMQAPPPLAPLDPEHARAAKERDDELRASLRALLIAEQVSGLELLESGHLADGAIGPVVLRMRDDAGRTVGTLCAERMHLEASLSARSVTLVLEDGYERIGGERIPFPAANDALPSEPSSVSSAAGSSPSATPSPVSSTPAPTSTAFGVAPSADVPAPTAPLLRSGRRRIELPHVDPRPWIEAVPELFRPADKEPPPDDGRWDLLSVRTGLNLLLRADVEHGTWRLEGLAGVQEGVLRDVQLDELDREGRLVKKLFADRLRLVAEERGLRLELESGAIVRGDAKTPFLDGRYRIFLPAANLADWRAAGLPGLSEPPPRKAR